MTASPTPTSSPCVDHAAALLPPEQAQAQASILKALADPVRLRLMHHIAAAPGGTVCSCTLPEALGISQPTMSHHLSRLVAAGLLTRERRGRWAHYSIDSAEVRRQIAHLSSLLPLPETDDPTPAP
ncbi:hypothetical protein KEM60_00135 [Austwickia sp. TVS 96-490-7B]|uniref:ArsR/SmtB family transcription factor n=1 Tax=Austwickia sp. TVS 96-490-7B TaxID=2830843 RepID=UPI001C59926C|nr:metalloregulator ArsR/SmtB family transcription factor [Austwickia sp. TVS 96-490-7B]MBW3083952.1 hypothetical protein [Austwickia sp. TVS 96-490-7B]